jgi:hypothetical protein
MDDNKVKALAADFRNSQVKILSFLTYLLRQFPAAVRQHQVCRTLFPDDACL